MSGSAGIWRLEWCSLNKVYPVHTSEIQPKGIHSIMLCSGVGWLCVLLFFFFSFKEYAGSDFMFSQCIKAKVLYAT